MELIPQLHAHEKIYMHVLEVVVYQIAYCRVEGRGAANFLYSILQNLECIGDVCERSCCHKCFMRQINVCDLSRCLCNRYYDIRKIYDKR